MDWLDMFALLFATDALLAIWFHDRPDGNGLFQQTRELLGYYEEEVEYDSEPTNVQWTLYYLAAALRCRFCLAFYVAAFVVIVYFGLGPGLAQMLVLVLAVGRFVHFLGALYERLTRVEGDPADISADFRRRYPEADPPHGAEPGESAPGTAGGGDCAGVAPGTAESSGDSHALVRGTQY